MTIASIFPYLRRLVGGHRVFAVMLLLALVLNVYLISAHPVQKIWGDEEEYIRVAHREQSFGTKIKRIIPGFMHFEWWPPFAFGVYGLLADPGTPPPPGESMLGDDDSRETLEALGIYSGFFRKVSVLNLFLLLLTAFNLYWLCILSQFGKKTAAVAAGLFLFNPRIIFYVQALWPELLHLAFLTLGLVLLILYDSRRRYLFLVPAGVLFGFCSLTKGIAAIFLLVLLPFLAVHEYRRSKKNVLAVLKILAVLYGCFLAVNVPQRISNYANHQTTSISPNRWINIELGFIPFQELRIDLHERYFKAAQDPRLREVLSKRRVVEYINSSAKMKILANQVNRFVFKQLNRSFLLMGLKIGRWELTPTVGYLGVINVNIALMLSWFIFFFGIGGLIIHRSLSYGTAIISIYVLMYLFFLFFIVHSARFFIQVLPFLTIFAASLLVSIKWRPVKTAPAKK